MAANNSYEVCINLWERNRRRTATAVVGLALPPCVSVPYRCSEIHTLMRALHSADDAACARKLAQQSCELICLLTLAAADLNACYGRCCEEAYCT
jgi:hypothetical protein